MKTIVKLVTQSVCKYGFCPKVKHGGVFQLYINHRGRILMDFRANASGDCLASITAGVSVWNCPYFVIYSVSQEIMKYPGGIYITI